MTAWPTPKLNDAQKREAALSHVPKPPCPVHDPAGLAMRASKASLDSGTHSEMCYGFGRKHYECALAEIERLRAALKEIRDSGNHITPLGLALCNIAAVALGLPDETTTLEHNLGEKR